MSHTQAKPSLRRRRGQQVARRSIRGSRLCVHVCECVRERGGGGGGGGGEDLATIVETVTERRRGGNCVQP